MKVGSASSEVAPQAVPAGPPPSGPSSAEPGASAPRQPRRFLPRSLTGRITTGVVGLVVVLVLMIGGGTYFALRAFLGQRLDQQLQSTARSAAILSRVSQFQAGPRPMNVWMVGLDPDSGRVNYTPAGTGLLTMELSASQRATLAQRTTQDPMTLRTADGTLLRITTRTAQVTGGGLDVPATLVVGLSTSEEQRTLSRLITLELLIGGAAVLVAIIATTYGVRFSLRRLHEVTDTAQEVAAELSPSGAGLDRRVPVVEEGTEVGQLAHSMNTLLAAVETQFAARLESEQRMRQFMADASHELRTPLTSIRGYAELARMQRAVGDAAADSGDNLDRIESEGTRMSRLVDDLLLLARGDADAAEHALHREQVFPADLVDDAVSGSRAAFPGRQIDMQVGDVPAVLGDRDQLLRVVRNLITNAAVHTDPARPIAVRAFPAGTGVSIQVIDGGPGLPPDQAAHVFERFWRADKARTRARGGSGLGLSIVSTIVRNHGGSVRFDSTVESGSTVTVWLPAAG